ALVAIRAGEAGDAAAARGRRVLLAVARLIGVHGAFAEVARVAALAGEAGDAAARLGLGIFFRRVVLGRVLRAGARDREEHGGDAEESDEAIREHLSDSFRGSSLRSTP